jgi:hypothetical protein
MYDTVILNYLHDSPSPFKYNIWQQNIFYLKKNIFRNKKTVSGENKFHK